MCSGFRDPGPRSSSVTWGQNDLNSQALVDVRTSELKMDQAILSVRVAI